MWTISWRCFHSAAVKFAVSAGRAAPYIRNSRGAIASGIFGQGSEWVPEVNLLQWSTAGVGWVRD